MARERSEGTCYISLELYFVLSHAFPIWLDDSVLPCDILNFLKHKRYISVLYESSPYNTVWVAKGLNFCVCVRLIAVCVE